MAETRSENVITWNFPNFITIVFMLALLWIALGFLSHGIRKSTGKSPYGVSGVTSDQSGNVVQA